MNAPNSEAKPRVVIVGAGFGGMAAAKALDPSRADIVLIDRANHHLFQPLLYQVATAALSPSDIATANRTLLRGDRARIVMAEVVGVDVTASVVLLGDGTREPFDHLVLAIGSAYSFFGHDSWERHALVLKSLEDALAIRTRLLDHFEAATRSTDQATIRRLLTFVVVGGGPTGVELAGTIAEFVRSVLPRDFASLGADAARVILAEGGERLLTSFTTAQSAYAERALTALGVEVRLGKEVADITADHVTIGDDEIATAMALWCAGTKPLPAAAWLGSSASKNGGAVVGADCSVAGHSNIFVIGDAATCDGRDGKPLPALAPVAKQQGKFVAALLNARIAGRRGKRVFRYRDWGALAVIGRSRAVATFGNMHLSGLVAWLTWALVHLALLVDFRSRVLVYVNWSWEWLHANRGVRLIIAPLGEDKRNGR
ncbi:MAG: NAD(P)/FAD-dependent oxidoreductase [Janthinobacterium lividum]